MPRACPPGRSCARTGSSVAAQKGVAGSMLAAPPRRTSHLVARSKATISTSVNMSAGLLTWLICGGLCLIGCWVSTRRAAAAPHGEPPPPSIYACASPGSPGLHPLRPPLPEKLLAVRADPVLRRLDEGHHPLVPRLQRGLGHGARPVITTDATQTPSLPLPGPPCYTAPKPRTGARMSASGSVHERESWRA